MKRGWLWEKLYFWAAQRFISWLEISKSLRLNSILRKGSFRLLHNLISWLHYVLMAPLRPQFPSLKFTSNYKLSNVVLFCLAPRPCNCNPHPTPLPQYQHCILMEYIAKVPCSKAWDSTNTHALCHNPFLTYCFSTCKSRVEVYAVERGRIPPFQKKQDPLKDRR